VLMRILWLWTRLPAEKGCGAAMCLVALDRASLLRRAPCCHVSRGFVPCLPTKAGSDATKCLIASNPHPC
jgi:hypothetical protein